MNATNKIEKIENKKTPFGFTSMAENQKEPRKWD